MPSLQVAKLLNGKEKIISVEFTVPEYNRDGTFKLSKYAYQANSKDPESDEGWDVYRNNEKVLSLGEGYVVVKGKYCGICSTDLARKFLIYPLPQIIGHEVVAIHESKPVVVEINASHHARGINEKLNPLCPFCQHGLATQCPDRITLGINQLPGGFAPYILAPVNAILPIPDNLSLIAATLAEPFAAALHAVETTPPSTGQDVAVLGPRKLGILLIAALHDYRKKYNIDFKITAIFNRNPPPQELSDIVLQLGSQVASFSSLSPVRKFDIVFDTTGTPRGFLESIKLSNGILHLKSTHGQDVCGLKRMSDFVVEEFSLLKYSKKNLEFTWPGEINNRRENHNILVTPSVDEETIINNIKSTGRNVVVTDIRKAADDVMRWTEQQTKGQLIDEDLKKSPVPRFDLVVIGDIKEIDLVVRPREGVEFSVLRPRGAILYAPPKSSREIMPARQSETSHDVNLLVEALVESNIQIWSTRCGNLKNSLEILSSSLEITNVLEKNMITKEIKLEDLDEGFKLASSKDAIKILVNVESCIN